MKRPETVITVCAGDPAGIGSFIIAKNLDEMTKKFTPFIFGHLPSFKKALEYVLPKSKIEIADEKIIPDSTLNNTAIFIPCGSLNNPIDKPDINCAKAQAEALKKAVDFVLAGKSDALVTAPVSKKLIYLVRPGFTGHTEYLAERAGLSKDDVTMVFASDKLVVGLVSTHIPIAEVPGYVTCKRLHRTLKHVIKVLSANSKNHKPSIAVASLNPHAGEDGLLGSEEKDIIEPFIEKQKNNFNANIEGPFPPETLFREALAGKYDGVVAMYHDQAMIPLKLTGLGNTVNITMGLPFVRTSPDHGVAYGIAKKNIASHEGFLRAFNFAGKLSKQGVIARRK